MRAAQGRDAAARLHLAEARAVGGDHDVGRQHHLDADGEAEPLHRGHDRLHRAAPQRKRIDIVRRGVATLAVGAEELRHVEPGCRVLAGEGEDGDP